MADDTLKESCSLFFPKKNDIKTRTGPAAAEPVPVTKERSKNEKNNNTKVRRKLIIMHS